MRNLFTSALVAIGLAATLASRVPLAQQQAAAEKPARARGQISTAPWPDDAVLLARRTAAQNRKLFEEGPPLEFALTADFAALNHERTPNHAKPYAAVLAVDRTEIPVTLSSRGHLRLKSQTCDFVPIRMAFAGADLAGTVFDGQSTVKLGTHCRSDAAFDQYVIREYLAYRLANVVTPLSFRARLARGTYIDARSHKSVATRNALFLEHENDVARRLGGREVKLPHLAFKDFDADALTTTMLVEYMLGNTDYSIWTLHNVVVVQDKARRFFPVPYDFDLSGMVNPPYAAPDPRLTLHSVTDRLYRGPCRTVEEFDRAAEPFRTRQRDMMQVLESAPGLEAAPKREMKDYLEGFFRRIATRDAIKRTFVDGCPATRGRV